METLKIFRINTNCRLPAKQTTQASCFDISFQGYGKATYEGYSVTNKNFKRPMNNQIVVQPGDRVMVPTGLIMDIPKGHSVRIHARSGMSLKQGLVLVNAEGVIDSDYVQEVMVLVTNISSNPITIRSGDRIAQGELIKDAEYTIEESPVRPGIKTNRTGGMGSTGTIHRGITLINEGPAITFKVVDETASVEKPKTLKKSTSLKKVAKNEPPVKRGRGRPKKNP
jgi:dUTP pyrophosphatase